MPIEITMPALSPTMEEGNLAKWLVKEGDKVEPGDIIAEIETDKATMEVEAIEEGTIAKLLVPDGTEGIKVNAVIALLADEGEELEAVASQAGAAAPAGGPEKQDSPAAADRQGRPADPPAGKQEDERTGDGGAEGRQVAAPSPGPQTGRERVFASPLARRLAAKAGIELSAIDGSGPNGRVVKADVEAAQAKGAPKQVKAEAPPAPVMADDAVVQLFEPDSFERIPHDAMRKTIARRLVNATTTIPHFYLTLDCDIGALLALRKQLNDAAPTRQGEKGEEATYKLSVNDMVIKALALALRDVPEANVTWTQAEMLKHRHADIGVAVSIPGGLITPVVRRADEKSLSAISNEMRDLAVRARDRRLKPQEYQGGSSAVSNLGMFGIKDFAAVINPPHATILAVGAGQERAVVRNGEIAKAHIMSVTLSCDHRAVDGALGAELLVAFRRYVESPLTLLV